MQQQRANPLYSRLGCAATIMLVLVLGAILRYYGGGPFSPGRLSAASPRNEPLSGLASHAEFEAQCALCHAPWRGVTGDRCENCHKDVAEQRKASAGLHGRLPEAGRCAQCHTEHKGLEATITKYDLAGFEHDWLTDFSLAKHETNYDEMPINCQDCHLEKRFDDRAVACLPCHETAEPVFIKEHRALFGNDCQACHDGQDTMVNFDHESVFPLEGTHVEVDCSGCHQKTILEGTKRECVGCHEEPVVHAGAFGLDCVRCHTSVAWLPAHLNFHTFPLDHGGEGKIECQTCHTQTYVEFTCTNCHAHEPDEIRAIHLEEGISEFEDCISCHPTGLKEEVEGVVHG